MFFNKLRKRFVIALLRLENPGKFIVHSRSLYFLYAGQGKKSRYTLCRQVDRERVYLYPSTFIHEYAHLRFPRDQGFASTFRANLPEERTKWRWPWSAARRSPTPVSRP